jgi:hypothetical protein
MCHLSPTEIRQLPASKDLPDIFLPNKISLLTAVVSSEDETAVPVAIGLNMTGLHLCLSTLFSINRTAWFVMAGDYFILRSIADEMLSYHPGPVLPCRLESAIIPMSDFVKGQLPVGPYK